MENENTMQQPASTNKGMNPLIIGGVVVVLLVIGAVAVFGMMGGNTPESSSDRDVESQNTQEAMTAETTEESDVVTEDEDAILTEDAIKVEGGSFYFKPNEIRVKVGEPVVITFNAVDMMHDFVIDELNVRTDVIKAGGSDTVMFTPSEVGEYEFYCSVGQHRANGMVGTLIVEE